MSSFAIERLRAAALLLALLPVSANSIAQAEPWPAWMSRNQTNGEFESQLSMARLNERHGKHEAAQKIYAAVLAKQPNNQLAHHRLAVMAAGSGDFATADQHFAAALKIGPSNVDLMGDMGYALFLQNRLEEAEAAIRKTIAAYPANKKAHNTLGMVLGSMGRYEEALAEFRQVVGEAEAHANLAFVMVQAGDLEQSSRHYHEAIKLDPKLRPAAEALVQLSGHVPGESSTMNGKAVARNQSAKVANPTLTAQSRSMSKPAPAAQMATQSQPSQSQEMLIDASAEPSATTVASHSTRHQTNATPEIARPFTPQAPTVPTQNEKSFAPAVLGLSQPDRLQPGIQATKSAHDNMGSQRQAVASTPDAPATTPASASDVFATPVSGEQAVAVAAQPATPAERIKAQVFNYEPEPTPPKSTVMASDDTEESSEAVTAASANEAETSESEAIVLGEEPKPFVAPGAYALAAARAQANLLTAGSSDQNAFPSEDSAMQPLPQPAAQAEEQLPIQGQPIASTIASPPTLATKATFIIAPVTAAEKIQAPAQTETPAGTELSRSSSEATATASASNDPAVWQIVLATMAGMLGLVALGKLAKYLGRRKDHSRRSELAPPAIVPTKSLEEQKYDVEETYTYLEKQIRDVCAGLPTPRSNDGKGKRAA